jgi:hypothetical protein
MIAAKTGQLQEMIQDIALKTGTTAGTYSGELQRQGQKLEFIQESCRRLQQLQEMITDSLKGTQD